MKNLIQNEINAHINATNALDKLTEKIATSAKLCIDCLNSDAKILIFGNGGSAADAQHFAAELVGRYKFNRKGLAALALTTDSSSLTSIGNDFGYNHIFERQVEALAKKGDVLIGISTSGKSKNVANALKLGSNLDLVTIGLTGKDGGEMNQICDINLIVPSSDTPRIQEIHILIIHIICQIIDKHFKT